MSQSDTCKVCGQLLATHHLIMRNGVAHTAVYVDGRSRSCSEEDCDRHYMLGEIEQLRTDIRSLRYRAGRLRNQGVQWNADDLSLYSNKLATDRDRLLGYDVEYYGWASKKESEGEE